MPWALVRMMRWWRTCVSVRMVRDEWWVAGDRDDVGRWWWWWWLTTIHTRVVKCTKIDRSGSCKGVNLALPACTKGQRVAHVFRWMEIVARIDRGHTWETANTGEALRHVPPAYLESGLLSNWTLKRIYKSVTILSILVWVAVFAVILCDIAVQISRISK